MTSQSSPYLAPSHVPHLPAWSLVRETARRYGGWMCLFSPVIAALPLYATWAVAWGTLGHIPRPGFDDPKYISDVVSTFYSVAMIGLIAVLPACLASFLTAAYSGFWPHSREQGHGAFRMALSILVCTAVIVLLRADPGRVVLWFFD